MKDSVNTNVMSISIVILSYNHPEITERCLLSVLKLVPTDFDKKNIILVHNGSVEKFRDFLTSKYSEIDHVVLNNNKGFSGGANIGLEYGLNKNNVALFLSNDCELLNWPKEIKCDGIIAPKIFSRKLSQVDSVGAIVDLTKGKPIHLKTNNLNRLKNINTRFYVPGSAFLIDHNSFKRLKGFDENLGTYWEDIDLSLRAQNIGIALSVNEDLHIIHKIGKTCHKHSHYTTYLYQRNRKIISRKYVNGTMARYILETNLVSSWVKMAFKLLVRRRTADLIKLKNAILD